MESAPLHHSESTIFRGKRKRIGDACRFWSAVYQIRRGRPGGGECILTDLGLPGALLDRHRLLPIARVLFGAGGCRWPRPHCRFTRQRRSAGAAARTSHRDVRRGGHRCRRCGSRRAPRWGRSKRWPPRPRRELASRSRRRPAYASGVTRKWSRLLFRPIEGALVCSAPPNTGRRGRGRGRIGSSTARSRGADRPSAR